MTSSATTPRQEKSKRGTVLISSFKKSWKNSLDGRRTKISVCGFYRASDSLPPIVEQTCCYLEQHALQSEGIFRVSGSQEDVRYIKDKFDKGKKIDLNKEANANTVAGVLKLFFTELPNPVLAFELYFAFMAAVELKEEVLRLWCVRRTIDTLPVGNRAIIDRVCAMFSIIQEFSDVNKMTAKNIALVMNPSMFRDKEGSMRELVSTGGLRVRLVQLLILNHKELFCDPKEVLQQKAKALESSLSDEAKKKLERFSALLHSGAIELASNLIREGETEINVQFDEDDDLITKPKELDIKNMSFEEFSKIMSMNPPEGFEGLSNINTDKRRPRNLKKELEFSDSSPSVIPELDIEDDIDISADGKIEESERKASRLKNRRSISMNSLLLPQTDVPPQTEKSHIETLQIDAPDPGFSVRKRPKKERRKNRRANSSFSVQEVDGFNAKKEQKKKVSKSSSEKELVSKSVCKKTGTL